MSIYSLTKTCSKCGQDKPLSEFSINKSNKDGHQSKCKDCVKEYNSRYKKENKSVIKEYRKNYYTMNRENEINNAIEYRKKRFIDDPITRFKHNVSSRIRQSINRKGYSKKSYTESIIGCDYNYFIKHIESQFTEDMSWNNYGTEWDIDHIIPISSANSEDEVMRLNHYTNLQPLNSYYNRHIKRDRVDILDIESLGIETTISSNQGN